MDINEKVRINSIQLSDYHEFMLKLSKQEAQEEIERDLFAAKYLVEQMVLPHNSTGEPLCKKAIRARVIDIGCGVQAKRKLYELIFDADYLGIDILPMRGCLCIPVEELQLHPGIGKADYIVCNHVMEHSDDPEKAVEGVCSLAGETCMIGQVTPLDEDKKDAAHLNYLTMDEWRALYEKHSMNETWRSVIEYSGVGDWKTTFHYQVFRSW